MSPYGLMYGVKPDGFPRPRGDEPGRLIDNARAYAVFPAHAGMSPPVLRPG